MGVYILAAACGVSGWALAHVRGRGGSTATAQGRASEQSPLLSTVAAPQTRRLARSGADGQSSHVGFCAQTPSH
eukprot:1751245-Prymnesium_polylepis.1